MFTQQEYNIHFQNNRTTRVKLDWLNWNEYKIDELQGNLLDGNISIDRKSAVRRTCNLSFIIDNDKFIPNSTGYIWLNKKFRLWIGIDNVLTGETVWFNQGIYILNEPIFDYNATDKTVRIQGLDKMCLYNGVLSGQLMNPTIIEIDSNITTAMRSLLDDYGETKFNMNNINKTTPYTIEKGADNTVYDILRELADLYVEWSDIYFDVNGYFVFEQNRERINDPIIWNFEENNFIINYRNEPNFANIKNRIQVWGHLHDNGIQTQYLIENNNIESDYAISKIGVRNLTIINDNLFINEQTQMLAEWELKQHSNLNEVIDISCVPIYMLGVNRLVYFNTPEIGIEGNYLIESINVPLNVNENMSFKAYKLY